MTATEPSFELGHFYSLEDFRAEWVQFLGGPRVLFSVPVTVTVTEDTYVPASVGRGFKTGWTYDEGGDNDDVILFEVYVHVPSLMAANYRHVGYVFLPERLSAAWIRATAEALGVSVSAALIRCLARFAKP